MHQKIKKNLKGSAIQKKQSQITPPAINEQIQTNSTSSLRLTTSSLPEKAQRDAIRRKTFGRNTPQIQTKLTIGEPGDKYEQEADRVAAQVVSQINSSASVQTAKNNQLQMKPMVQRVSNHGMTASPDLETSIQQARGSGQPLADSIKSPMEEAFGADFSGVKIHTNTQADQLNQSIQAKAFTTGEDVFFRQGEYNPASRTGQQLIAHELTHVVQQNGGSVQRSPFVQRVERQTTIYTKQGDNWQKNMQIIDSNSASDYVHVSRSTNTDPESINKSLVPKDLVYSGGRRERVEIGTDSKPNFDRTKYTAANNVHITLEGRYMQVMYALATQMLDDRDSIKNGPPVLEFGNLNFGALKFSDPSQQNLNFSAWKSQGQQQVSNYSIQQWIEIAAEDTEDLILTNTVDEWDRERIPELIKVVREVRDSTLNFTNHLIASTPELKFLEQNNRLVHYNGTSWARTLAEKYKK
ncbi:DUF4157 domain-containing protein [Calothrix sp. FACHB-156]|nr:DUF4157 domain-containing protein [Calothrix sp. FACHB-156]